MATSFPLTKHGAQLLKDELQRLKSVERPNVINAIAEARAQGDLSENAEYESAKERQSFIEGRIAELEGKLSAAQIIDPAALDADGRVVFGATVQLEDIDSGDKVTYQIVGEDERPETVQDLGGQPAGPRPHRQVRRGCRFLPGTGRRARVRDPGRPLSLSLGCRQGSTGKGPQEIPMAPI